jgi:uncharacterized protein YycO
MSNNVKIQLPNGQTTSVVKQETKSVSVSAPTSTSVAITSSIYQIHDKHYTHTQTVSQTTWSIRHDLLKKPSVTVVDSADNVVIGQVEYTNDNELILTFNYPFKGKAYLN